MTASEAAARDRINHSHTLNMRYTPEGVHVCSHCGLPAVPEGRLDGQRFFRVAGLDFYYLGDTQKDGLPASRPEVWLKALDYAIAKGAERIEERTNQRLNDYVGPGVFGLCMVDGKVSERRMSGNWIVGVSILVGLYPVVSP